MKNKPQNLKEALTITMEDVQFSERDRQKVMLQIRKERKKSHFMETKEKGGLHQTKRKRNGLLIAAACFLIGVPTTVLGAVKVYEMMVEKQNYEVNVSVANGDVKKGDNWYKLKVGKLPENMEAIDDTAMKYSFKDNYARGGFSFILWRLGENSDFQTLYSNSYEKKMINGREAVIIDKDNGNNHLMFNRQVFLFFEEEGIMLESYIGADVNEEQMMNVLENISLEPTSRQMASDIIDYAESQINNANPQTEFHVIPLKKDSKRLFNVGEVVPVTIDQVVTGSSGTISKLDTLEFVIEKVEVFDSIRDYKKENFNEMGLEILSKNKALDEMENLLPYNREVYKTGNGKDTIDELIESKSVRPKFIYLTATVKNIGKQATEEIYMTPSLQILKSENNVWKYAEEIGILEKSIKTGEVDYLEPHGNEKDFYKIGSIQPGQTMKINLGYFVDEDKLDSLFLDAFHYSGSGETEDMNAEDRWWIDIRQ